MNPTKTFANLDKLVNEIEALKKANSILSELLSLIVDEGEPIAEVAQVWRNLSESSDDRHDQDDDFPYYLADDDKAHFLNPDEFCTIKTGFRRTTDGHKLAATRETINLANTFAVTAGTNGLKGGDSGHGCRTYLRFEDLGGTDMRVYTHKHADGTQSVELVFGGDSELDSLIESLRFAAYVLEDRRDIGLK